MLFLVVLDWVIVQRSNFLHTCSLMWISKGSCRVNIMEFFPVWLFINNFFAGLVGLQAAVMEPQTCKGILLINISLRMLHIKKQPWFGRPFIKSFQNLLRYIMSWCLIIYSSRVLFNLRLKMFMLCVRNTALGKSFFKTVATPESVKNILCQVLTFLETAFSYIIF